MLSLRIAVVATVVALPFAPVVRDRLGCWRASTSEGKALLDGIVHLPLVLPPVVTGYLLLISVRPAQASSARSSRTLFGIVFSFRWTGAALACGRDGLFRCWCARSGSRIDGGGYPSLEDRLLDARRQSSAVVSPP
jgi:ABC-type Fe3+ transport system permease subunit